MAKKKNAIRKFPKLMLEGYQKCHSLTCRAMLVYDELGGGMCWPMFWCKHVSDWQKHF